MYKERLGRASWKFLHTLAEGYPDKPTASEKQNMKKFFKYFSNTYSCPECKSHFKELLTKIKPKFDSRTDLQRSFCQMHNG